MLPVLALMAALWLGGRAFGLGAGRRLVLVAIPGAGWLAVMIGQYVADPKAIYQVRPMVPRR